MTIINESFGKINVFKVEWFGLQHVFETILQYPFLNGLISLTHFKSKWQYLQPPLMNFNNYPICNTHI
jgi:hypothetical protein